MIIKKESKKRPKNLNLLTIRLPINAIVSIAHRASGVVLFLLTPLLLLALFASVYTPQSYANLVSALHSPWAKAALCALSLPFIHHFFAGLRHLGRDVNWMSSLENARFSGRIVLALDVIFVALLASWLW